MSVSGSRTAIVASSGGAAPSGILVANTSTIIIQGNGAGTYSRIGTGTNPMEDWTLTGYAYRNPNQYFQGGDGTILFAPNSIISDGFQNHIDTPYSSWALVYMYYYGEYSSWITSITSINDSTDANYIPTSGWSPSITITAA
jgi:hypothetical protein